MLDGLARASLDGAVLVCLIWALSRALPALSPAARTTLWWCAAAKFVVGLAWTTPILLPVLPAPSAGEIAPVQIAPPAGTTVSLDATGVIARGASDRRATRSDSRLSWTMVLGGVWLIGVGISTGLGIRRWRRIRAVICRSSSADASTIQSAASVAAIIGLRRVPDVRLSDDVDSPLVSGLLRPLILLPASRFPAMTDNQQRMALCHELAHIKRRDVWLGLVPAMAERIFFFHPLVRLAAREYVFWREAACDAAVIASLDTAPQSYGRLLLDLGVTGRAAALTPAGAAWSFSNLKRRIVMLRRPAPPSLPARALTLAAVAAAMTAVAPFQLTSRAAVTPAIELPVAKWPQPTEAVQEQKREEDENLRFVSFLADDHTTMSGSSDDIQRARRHRKNGEQLLWFIHGGKEFVVRDADTLETLQAIWEPVGEIGAEQGKIGARQGEIGARQGEIGMKQGVIGAEQGAIGARQGAIGSKQGMLAAREGRRLTEKEREEIERERQGLDKEMRELDREMRALNEKMRQLEQPMKDLGDDMAVLGREMAVLGRKMEEASRKARKEMRALIEKAIRSGAAQEVR